MDFENAVLFESQGVDWLQREMHHGAGRVGSLDLLLCRGKSRVHARVVDDQGASLRIRDQFGRASLEVLLGYVGRVARAPLHLHEIGRSAGRGEAVRIDHDPARRRARRIVQSEASEYSRARVFAAESSIETTLES